MLPNIIHYFTAFGVSSNGTCPLHGCQYIANNTNSFQSKTATTMSWSNSPSFISNVSAHQPSHIHGISGGQPQMLNTVPLHHHVGSAPAVNPSLWDRRFAYSGDSIEPLVFHSGSLGNKGLASITQLESLQPASCNFFPHSCGNCLDPCISHAPIGIPSAQQRSLMFHGRSPMVSMPGSFDGRVERIRSRTSDATANQGDNKKQYELDIECIRRGEDSRTTLMIKNIPNKYEFSVPSLPWLSKSNYLVGCLFSLLTFFFLFLFFICTFLSLDHQKCKISNWFPFPFIFVYI